MQLRCAVVVLAVVAVGCVNDYQIPGETDVGSEASSDQTCASACTSGLDGPTSEPTNTTTVATEDTASSSSSSSSSSDGGSDAATGTDGATAASSSSTGPDLPLEMCQPCSADNECGDPPRLCVELLDAMSYCMRPCTEAPEPCGATATCMLVTSVDGQTAEQCYPNTGMCGEPAVML